MTPAELSAAVREAVQATVDAGDLSVPVPESVKVERPKVREHGDYATSVALQLAKPAGRTSRGPASSTSLSTRPPRASWPAPS
jgi:arginyl-tRNA synthetase